ncbi:helix-turn-helix transcriptional regulator [Pseudorhodoplanes sp.]|uniref:S24 family peptidase n=1 Tax=Pseudorhodoplanes sp. TaxID=1934341 RepID=UPI003918FE89
MDLDPIRLKVLDLVERAGTDLKKASLACGKNAAYVHQFIYRGTPKILPEDVREALAKHLGVTDRVLRHPEVPQRKAPARQETRHEDEHDEQLDARKRPRRSAAGFSPITEIDMRASAGPGAFHEGLEEAKSTWLFPDEVIRHEFRARPEDLHIVTIDGDSMEPLLSSGDRIMVDTSRRVPAPPGIFVIWDGMGIVAKRIEHVPHSDPTQIIIKSLNPEYQTYERNAEDVNIIGRVVWASKRL